MNITVIDEVTEMIRSVVSDGSSDAQCYSSKRQQRCHGDVHSAQNTTHQPSNLPRHQVSNDLLTGPPSP